MSDSVEEVRARLEAVLVELDKAKQELDKAKEQADRAEANNQKTSLYHYLKNIQTFISPVFDIETRAVANVNVHGKVYPKILKRWDEFSRIHRETFDKLATEFGDELLFPSTTETTIRANNLSPDKRRIEQDIDPFVRTYMESPAAKIVNKYLERTKADHTFSFHNSIRASTQTSSGMNPFAAHAATTRPSSNAPSGVSSAKRRYQVPDKLTCDRYGMRQVTGKTEAVHVLVGEYKAAHKLGNDLLRRVLGMSGGAPAESLVADCAARAGRGQSSTATPGPVDVSVHTDQSLKQDEMAVANVLCQAYHDLIAYGIQHGYITSGEGTVLLRVSPAAPDTLYYHYVDHALPSLPIAGPAANLLLTAPAQLATLSLEALKVPRVAGYVFGDISLLPFWPDPPSESGRDAPTTHPGGENSPPDDDDEDASGDGTGASTGSPGAGGDKDDDAPPSRYPYRSDAPLPRDEYCTQACLLGLTRGGVLDPNCPNTPEHLRAGGSKGVRPGADGQPEYVHAITAAELCTLFVAQQRHKYHSGVDSLFSHGMHGALVTLYKVTLLAYGYTFVGKGVCDTRRQRLDAEAAIYTHPDIVPLQGNWIPVHLGTVELEEYPLIVPTGQVLWHLMLLSWAGESLRAKLPPHMKDWDETAVMEELEKFALELCVLGLGHCDVRLNNFTWNVERGHLMAIDFDHSEIVDADERREMAECGSPEDLPDTDDAATKHPRNDPGVI